MKELTAYSIAVGPLVKTVSISYPPLPVLHEDENMNKKVNLPVDMC